MDLSRVLPVAIPIARIWVRSQRNRYRFCDQARSLTQIETAALSPFFASEILEQVRVAEVFGIPNPSFYSLLRRLGIKPPLDISHAGAITFDDTVVVVRRGNEAIRSWYPLLFHELVHVVQYASLGSHIFVDKYLRGLAAVDMDYYRNPFEREAYALQSRFETAPHIPFSVVDELRTK
jgi:hypothetical protein